MSLSLIWLLFGVAFLFAEIVTPVFVLFFLGIGAWAAALAALAGFAMNLQISVFIVVSILALLVLRRKLRAILSGREHTVGDQGGSDTPPHPLTGRQGVVSKAIAPTSWGEVEIDGSFWRAKASEPLALGTAIRVLGSSAEDALILHVARLEER